MLSKSKYTTAAAIYITILQLMKNQDFIDQHGVHSEIWDGVFKEREPTIVEFWAFLKRKKIKCVAHNTKNKKNNCLLFKKKKKYYLILGRDQCYYYIFDSKKTYLIKEKISNVLPFLNSTIVIDLCFTVQEIDTKIFK